MGNGYVAAGASYTDDVVVKNGSLNVVDPDADTLTLTIKDPDGVTVATIVQDDLTRVAEGQYRYTWAVPADADTGAWTWRWDATVEGADLPDAVVTVVVLPQGSLASPDAYATVAELTRLLPPTTGSRDATLLLDLLVRASAYISVRSHRWFTAGEAAARLFDVGDSRLISIPGGIYSATLVEQAPTVTGTFATIDSGLWSLSPRYPAPGEPYAGILIADEAGLYANGVVRVTGVYSPSSVPTIIRGGTLALAREMFAALPGRAGGVEVDANGIPRFLPEETYRAIEWASGLGPISWFA